MWSVPGGSGANQAAWLAHIGLPTRLAARVGAADADRHRAALVADGVDARLGEDTDAGTGNIVVIVGSDNTRSMFTDRGANRRLGAGDLDPGLLDGMDHLHVSGYALVEAPARLAISGLWAAAGANGLTRARSIPARCRS